MPTLMFQERFAELVRTGQKRQTIRPKRKRPIKPGDLLSLRKWEGKAYRSKQVELLNAKAVATIPIEIWDGGMVLVHNYTMPERDKNQFAQEDGFADFDEMYRWFSATHTLPFLGVVIKWESA